MSDRFDPEIKALIPHREPMLLVNRLVSVEHNRAEAQVVIDEHAPFYSDGLGVPAWIGLEYMGQTAALIAGYQQRQGNLAPHLGFLMGSRHYQSDVPYFATGSTLLVECCEDAVVGDHLATFKCTISQDKTQALLATALLSVFRRPLSENEQ